MTDSLVTLTFCVIQYPVKCSTYWGSFPVQVILARKAVILQKYIYTESYLFTILRQHYVSIVVQQIAVKFL